MSVICKGPVIRVRTNSSSGMPDAFSTTQPRMSVLYPYTKASPGCATNGSVPRRSMVSQIGSLLSAVYQPFPAAGPRPFAS